MINELEGRETTPSKTRKQRKYLKMKALMRSTACLLAVLGLFPTIASAQNLPDGYFKLTTQFREGENECLEGNQRNGSMDGAAFMDRCQDVSGQLWRATRNSNGLYTLTTQFREGENECLEGNAVGGSMGGASFMNSCQDIVGQRWEVRPEGDGYFRLLTQGSSPKNECLEGNQVGGSMNGAAFMDRCQDVSGQLWRVAE